MSSTENKIVQTVSQVEQQLSVIHQVGSGPIALRSASLKDQKAASSTNPRGLLDLPAEVVDMILGHACASYAVSIIQPPRMSHRPRSPIIITPRIQSADNGGGLAPLAFTNSLLCEHLKRCLHTPASFSGYPQLVDVDLRCLLTLWVRRPSLTHTSVLFGQMSVLNKSFSGY